MFAPTITGFGAADVIDFTDPYATITAAHYAAGELNIYAGATIVATLNLSGTYKDYFSTVPLNGGSTYQIDYEGGAPTSTAPAGTTTSDAYQWVGPVAGFWNAKANWDDTSTGQNPAAAAPGVNDTVTVAAAANGEAQVIDGAGNAYGLTLEGETLLQGKFKVVGTGADGGLTATSSASVVLYSGSSIAVSGDATFSSYAGATLNGGAMTVTGTVYGGYGSPFVIENGGSLTAGQLVDYYSSYSVLAGGTVTVDGNVSDSGTGSAASSYSVNGGRSRSRGSSSRPATASTPRTAARSSSRPSSRTCTRTVSRSMSTTRPPRSRSARPAAPRRGRSPSTPATASRNPGRSPRRRSSTTASSPSLRARR